VAEAEGKATSGDYWVEISQGGARLGAGFLLTRCYALTALHCLRGITPGNDEVEISFATGEVRPGRVHRRAPEADLALIDIPKSDNCPAVPRADRAGVGETWYNPYRPSMSHAFLSGNVAAVPVAYQCEGGAAIEAIQLGCLQDLGDYAGYSGSPIERNGPDESRALLGVLLEQYPEQYPDYRLSERASSVLFAATITEVFRRFDCFDMDHLFKILAPSPRERSNESSPKKLPQGQVDTPETSRDRPRLTGEHIESSIGAAGSILEALHEWQISGLLDGLDVPTLTSGIVQNLISDVMRDGA
jgi:hypothetical protein